MKEDKHKLKLDIIANALAKLTTEEQEILGLIKKPKTPRVKRHYTFTINYMIGDANGNTFESATIDTNNPFLARICNALDKLRAPAGHWGITFNDKCINANYQEGNINVMERDLLSMLINFVDENTFDQFIFNHGFEASNSSFANLEDFEGLFRNETEYSFLVYQGYTLK